MDRAGALAALDARILSAYSARTVEALRSKMAMRMALPYLEPVLELNIEKEARKDGLVIAYAAEAAARGERPRRELAQEIFAATKSIDTDFLKRVDDFPVQIHIPYEEIEPLRLSRIRYVLDIAFRLLTAWQGGRRLRHVLRETYEQADFELMLSMILDLYARETRTLSRSLELPAVLASVGERAAHYLSSIMADAGARLAHEVARGAYTAKLHRSERFASELG